MHEEAITNRKKISAGVPHSSVLGPILNILHAVGILIDNDSMTAMFADDNAIQTTSKNQQSVTEIFKP